MTKNKLQMTGEIIAGHIFGTDTLKAEHQINLMFDKIQRIKNPIDKLQAYLDSAKYLTANKSAYWQVSAIMFKKLLREKTDLAKLVKDKIVTEKQLADIGLKAEGEKENWKLLCRKNERGKGFNVAWFCNKKIGISLRHIQKMIEVEEKFKEYGLTKEQVQEIGLTKIYSAIKENGVPRNAKINLSVLKNKTREEVQGYSKSRRVWGSTKNFDTKQIKEFISYLKKDERFKEYIK